MNDLQSFFNEIRSHLLQDETPSQYLNRISDNPQLRKYPFDMLYKLRQTHQSSQYHPEGSVWNHTMLVTDEAAKRKVNSKNPEVFMWAALLHDIGKPAATKVKNRKLISYDHEKIGEKLADEFLRTFLDDDVLIRSVTALVRWHMQFLFVVNDLPYANIKKMKQDVDIREIALLGLCDRLGRLRADKEKEEENRKVFLLKCRQ